jgi:dolichol-phosphate mannosyltransferase
LPRTAVTPVIDAPSVCVVIPTYNERENLQALVPRLLSLDLDLRIIVVDDGSPDGTGEVADRLAACHLGRIHVLHRAEKQGIGPAYRAGLAAALATDSGVIAQMDADLSHDPDDLPRLVAAARDADLVLGSRYVSGGSTHGWPWFRKAISRFGGSYARLVLDVPVHDLTGGFKVYRRATLEGIGLSEVRSDGYVFQIETTYRALKRGFTVREVPVAFTDRIAGKSKLSRRIVAEAMIVVWRLRLDRSLRTPQPTERPF